MLFNIKNTGRLLIAAVILIAVSACKKFLDKKPDTQLAVPTTLRDFQAMLDRYTSLNQSDISSGEVSSDNYYLIQNDYGSITDNGYQRMYLWEKDNFFTGIGNDWGRTYDNIFDANTILEQLGKLTRDENNAVDWDNIRGQALFLRARSFLQLAIVFSLAYDKSTANTDLGLPLRLEPDFNKVSVRSSVQETYNRIISDLGEAHLLLPVTPQHVLRASRTASYALLARTYMAMRMYDSCFKYTDLTLQLKDTLFDFNNFSTAQLANNFPFSILGLGTYANPEIIFASRFSPPTPLSQSRVRIDSLFYKSYATNDRRREAFYRVNSVISGVNTYTFKGSYEGSASYFSGISTNELYLMRAECYARMPGKISEAMNDLNKLMKKRITNNSITPYQNITAATEQEALTKILTERRKELPFRGLRWMDIKRLNKEGANIILVRNMNGQTYTLQPNHIRYALPIPESVIALSGMQQNPR